MTKARGTGCWRRCARTAWSGWPKRARSRRRAPRSSRYYLNLAETADPELRAANQRHWLRELAAEQDNLHAALRWAIVSQDADTALRFVRALGWYWMLRGQPGEPEALARQALALEPRERSPRIAEARIVGALTAVGTSWDMDAMMPVLAAALADFAELSPDGTSNHPVAAMGEPMCRCL